MQDPSLSGQSKSWVKLLVIAILGFFLLLFLTVGGILFFVFYKLKDSESAKMAVQVLRENPVVRENLGEIQDTGWPVGSFSVDAGGSGKANFSMSVQGSKAKGKYYASLYRQHGIWHYRSGRLELADGRALDIAGSGEAAPAALPPPPSGPGKQGGRVLKSDADTSAWRELSWPEQPIVFKVPAEWKQGSLERRSVEFRPEDRSAYFTANLTYFDQKIPYESLFPSLLEKAAHQWERGEILGYAKQDLGRAQGFWELSRRGDGQSTVAWTGYYDDEKYGTVSLTLLLGAPSPEDFDRAEPVLGAILKSLRVK